MAQLNIHNPKVQDITYLPTSDCYALHIEDSKGFEMSLFFDSAAELRAFKNVIGSGYIMGNSSPCNRCSNSSREDEPRRRA